MTAQSQPKLTPQKYLTMEHQSESKSEYWDYDKVELPLESA